MCPDTNAARPSGWMDSSGLAHLLRTFGMAVMPGKIALALAGMILTVFSGIVLDLLWTAAGQGVRPDELADYLARRTPTAQSTEAPVGVFHVLAHFEMSCLRDGIESIRNGRFLGAVQAGEPATAPPRDAQIQPVRGALTDVVLMGRGVVWLCTQHVVYAVLWLPAFLLIWSFFGGAICRLTAVQFARDESITIIEAMGFARQKLFKGFFGAPLLPLAVVLTIGAVLMIFGVVLRIPWLGDVVGGLLFFLALAGGTVLALVLTGSLLGGSFFFPTIAAEGSESFDAAARGISYVYSQPLRTFWYAAWLAVFGSFGFLVVMFLVWLAAASTHLFVGIGSGVFLADQPNKLTQLWAPPTFEALHGLGGQPQGIRWVSAYLIAMWVLLLWGCAWAFLVSFYYSGSTIAYFLVRRDVDGTDLGEVYAEESAPLESSPSPAPPTPSPTSKPGDISLPVAGTSSREEPKAS